MKYFFTAILTITVILSGCSKPTHNGFPVLRATSNKADFRIGSDLLKGSWQISPQIEYDSLKILCHRDKEEFAFYTDRDSIVFNLKAGDVHKFYVLLNDTAYAMTVIEGVKANYAPLDFDTEFKNDKVKFWYDNADKSDYLKKLRTQYKLEELIKGKKSDTEKALAILHWVHSLWPHNGNNTPQKNDAISIIEEAKNGKNFRCVEYGIVTAACLNAVGLKARVLALKTKDVETTKYGAGHVVTEVYLNDLKKWVFLDGQWDVMPLLNGIPLNAVEFQKAIAQNFSRIEIRSAGPFPKRQYLDWVYPYLFYFSTSFDNRTGKDINKRKIDGKTSLMLVPLGSKNPTIFQMVHKIDYCLYTNSLNDFYRQP